MEQETFNVASVSCLEDCDLVRLLALLERARECILDGVSLEDAGLTGSTLRKGGEVRVRQLEQIADNAESAVGKRLRDAVRLLRAELADEAPF